MKIKSLEVLTNHLDATTAFYQDVIGLEYAGGTELTSIFRAGDSLLTFVYTKAVIKPVYHFAFTLPCNQLKEALGFMSERVGILPLPAGELIADFSGWHAHAFYFYDNNGNVLEYIVRYDLHNDSGRPFSGKSICCISEAGIVTSDVPALAAQLSAHYHIPCYSRQPPQAHFTVMGDDHGLLILSAAHRKWFPTQIGALSFPLRLIFTGPGGKEQMFRHGYG